MKRSRAATSVEIPRGNATVETVARTALEMTATCYVWIERTDNGVTVHLEEKEHGSGGDLEGALTEHLETISILARKERMTRPLRSAIVARAFGPRPEPKAPPSALPELDEETEAEIEKLLAEIESDDWLDDASDIAKTWEERFGDEAKSRDGEEGKS